MISVSLTINKQPVTAVVEPRTLLANFLREDQRLTGTHIGCDTTQCGCCTVIIDGDAVKSCTVLVAQLDRVEITTIEGLARGDSLHPLQQAFMDNHGLQCGFCTPGFIMSALELIEKNEDLDEETVRHGIEGNICRCTGYINIVKAILSAAETMKTASRRA
ncbi:(2Fe-2S)-binding protein [Rhizobium lusitanum]|uniref:(2Fe-2S)-binding protein n=1 Tax=Rhizobium lusitanum TaxID=293958 RepID=UPI0015727934|nr:(2Fe-2S)-binding protein [Rhizobium lusitanum]NTJ11795.1 (2Fe-2S)-binding protein [Rhizobium lusitanum]